MFSSGFYMPGNFLGTMSDFVGLEVPAASGPPGMRLRPECRRGRDAAAADGLGGALAGPAAGVGGLGSVGGAVSAALGRGAAIGALAVPPSWNAIAPTTSPIAPLLGGAPISAPPAVAAGMPGMPARQCGRKLLQRQRSPVRFPPDGDGHHRLPDNRQPYSGVV